ncbi:hypothetical protein Q8F55_003339 [Vanrija albida]|uniref:Uncharacterized protein n=1 Tax=Vanrija albida TaxID=181172 RepID=A0ABR3Q4I3_9TREE
MASAASDSKPPFTPSTPVVPTPPESGAATAASTPASFATAEQDDRGAPMDVDEPTVVEEPTFPTPPTTEPGSASADKDSRDSKPEQASSSKGKARETSPTPAPTPDAADLEPEPESLESRLAKLDLKDLGDGSQFTVEELYTLLEAATQLKDAGNKLYTSRPPKLDAARDDYLKALSYLPAAPKHLPPPSLDELAGGDRFREISDDEAEQIEADEAAGYERVTADLAIRDAQRAIYGNLGAVYAAQKKDKETVDACTKALTYDPTYIKALQRRAAANERIGTWNALAAAQRDLSALLVLLPIDSPQRDSIHATLDKLAPRIKQQQEKEKADVLGKLNNL